MIRSLFVVLIALLSLSAVAEGVRVSERFGYDSVDATANLQAALDSGLPEIVVDRKDGPWVVRPLFAKSNQKIVFEKGVVLLAKRGEYVGRNDRILTIKDCHDVEIVGNGAVLRMWRGDYMHGKDGTGTDYRRGEWRHTLAINGSQRVTVDGLVLEESGGDGIYVSEGGSLAKDIVIRNCVCDRNLRQGLSIISGENILVEKCVFKNTHGGAPEDGVDIEPNDPEGHCVNIVIRDCVSENNAGNGFEAALSTLRATTRPVSVRFENCRSTGDRYGAKIRTCVDPKKGDYPTGSVVYDHCTFTKTVGEAINVQQVPAQAFEMRFDDCTFEEIGTKSPDAPLIVLFSMYDGDPKPALPKMKNVRWPDRGNRRPYVYDILDPSVFGQETLATVPVNLTNARIVDTAPGEFVPFAPVAIRHYAKYYVYADRAREITLAAKQVRVGGALRKAVKGKVDVVAADGAKVATLDMPDYDGARLVFAAPKAGFYTLEFKHGVNAIELTGADAPVALDVTARTDRRGRKQTVNVFRADGSFFVPVAAGARAEIRAQGSAPGERVGLSVVDPAGQVAFADPSVLYATRYQTPASAQDGVWELRLRLPKVGYPEDSSYELAGVPPLFFLSKDKYWLPK